ITPGSCPNRYAIARTYHATDSCGNSSSHTQNITVDDETAPVISNAPADTTVSCASEVPAADDNGVSATDNCGGTVTVTHDADQITPGSCPNRYTIARTYHAADSCGNSSSHTQNITVDDETAPVISSAPADTTVSCASQVPAADDSGVSATDNCGGPVAITHDADQITPGSCDNRYTIARTYHATDSCGNSSSHTQNITVDDETAPVIDTYPGDSTVSCASEVPPADNSSVTAHDNCNGTVAITHDADQITPGSCDNRYTIARTYHATDSCGNSSSHTHNITVDDETAPVIDTYPNDSTVSCASEVAPADNSSVTAHDNCNGTVAITHDADQITPGSCDNRYTIARTYHATDSCGNSSSHTQNITVDDETAPVIDTYPNDSTVSCASEVPPADNSSVTAHDNCNGTVTVTHDADQTTPGSCDNHYT